MDETYLMVTRAGRREHTPEAEPVLVQADDDTVLLGLDDGETIEFDRSELLAALEHRRAA